ncbi:MAG: hypothetical protein IRY99_13170 [Isosphaeraceae bacterium]|nr:hypothetical protein [Isosphaeraceae bacterium]
MPRATCRCGQLLIAPDEGSARVICPRCGARVRIRRKRPGSTDEGDGYIRFSCPCGRRLKVSAVDRPAFGKCPDCGRVVPVPERSTPLPPSHPESPTEELCDADLALLDRWASGHLARADASEEAAETEAIPTPTRTRSEVGLRVCPGCGRPVHLGASTCRECGTPVPRR